MDKDMGKRMICELAMSLGLVAALSAPALAGSPEANLLKEEIVAKVPANWQVHVSMRDKNLVIFLMPPYQEAFNLWYEPEKLHARMLELCPGPNDAIWAKLPADQGVAIEPTVGGKSAEAMRISCKRTMPPPA